MGHEQPMTGSLSAVPTTSHLPLSVHYQDPVYDPLNVGRSYEVENKKALEDITELNQASQSFNQQK